MREILEDIIKNHYDNLVHIKLNNKSDFDIISSYLNDIGFSDNTLFYPLNSKFYHVDVFIKEKKYHLIGGKKIYYNYYYYDFNELEKLNKLNFYLE